ncbi:kelch repeat-containing protein [Nonomuraea sp. NPDC003214]
MKLWTGSAAIGVRGTKVYLAGGMLTLTPGPGGLQDTVATYDVVSGRWEKLSDLPEARDHVGGAVIGSTFYVVGGRDRGQVNVRDTVYAFDLRTRRWSERAPMPTVRGRARSPPARSAKLGSRRGTPPDRWVGDELAGGDGRLGPAGPLRPFRGRLLRRLRDVPIEHMVPEDRQEAAVDAATPQPSTG